MKRPLVIVISLIFLLTLGFFLSRRIFSPRPSVKTTPIPPVSVVALTKEGFNPKSITISKGTAVRWINQSGVDQSSVNSDNYPDNKLYPELNLGQFKNGASLVHIFNSPGTYTYHNQFSSKQIGKIIVK